MASADALTQPARHTADTDWPDTQGDVFTKTPLRLTAELKRQNAHRIMMSSSCLHVIFTACATTYANSNSMFTQLFFTCCIWANTIIWVLTLHILIVKVYTLRPFSKNKFRVYPPPHVIDTSIPTLPSVLSALVLFTACKRKAERTSLFLEFKNES